MKVTKYTWVKVVEYKRKVVGSIVIEMNYLDRRTLIGATLFGTPDYVHRVTSWIDGKQYNQVTALGSEEEVLEAVAKMQANIEEKLKELAAKDPEPSFVYQLKEMGFKI